MGANHVTVWNTMTKDNNLHPYKVSHHQQLQPHDVDRRFEMCDWFLDKIENVEDPGEDDFIRNVMFTDECTFGSDGTANRHNSHHWAAKGNNPHCYQNNRRQGHFSVNVWAGIVGDFIVGPYFLEHNVNAENYANFLNDQLPVLLGDLPAEVRRNMWFQQDGHPAHTSLVARGILNRDFPD
ncbi:hypothetical protein FOCC_FOCC010914, partial [Frankliniella occidentalis]